MKLGGLLSLLVLALSVSACSSDQALRAETHLTSPAAGVGPEPQVYKRTVLSREYHIDKKYRSMLGPASMQKVALLEEEGEPELLWIVGYEAVVMNGKGDEQVSQEFMCHSNLDFNARDYWEAFKSDASMSGRLFTLSQGQQDVDFPKGYGIPVMSTMSLDLATQVLNLNLDDADLDVRHKVTIEFVRERDVITPMKPLYQAAVQGFKTLEGKPADYGYSKDELASSTQELDEHAGCSVGMPAVKGDVDKDRHGQKFTGHWIVEPGREVNKTNVTKFLQLQFDTTIHYIAVHLHPFAESLELIDKTTGKRVFKANAKQTDGKIGLAHIDHFTSVEGLPIYKDHEYELISVYNNTTNENQDSMAVMYLYVQDVHFKKPTAEDIAALKKKAAEQKSESETATRPKM
jgi:hypothetical protein